MALMWNKKKSSRTCAPLFTRLVSKFCETSDLYIYYFTRQPLNRSSFFLLSKFWYKHENCSSLCIEWLISYKYIYPKRIRYHMRASKLFIVCLRFFCIFILKYYVNMVLDFRNYNSFSLSSNYLFQKFHMRTYGVQTCYLFIKWIKLSMLEIICKKLAYI